MSRSFGKKLTVLSSMLGLVSAIRSVYPPENAANNSRVDLYFGFITSFGNTYNSSGTVPAVQIALDLINDHPTLLPNYKLHYQLTDSQCNRSVVLDAFFTQVFSDVPKLGIVGSGCSLATEPTAEISHFYNITQLSCASSSSELADRIIFKSYFQMLPTELELVPGFIATLKQYNWRYIAIINQEENVFINTVNNLKVLFLNENIKWSQNKFETKDGPLSLGDDLFENDARIFFLAMYPPNTITVLCEAFKTGRIYPRYTFITYGWYRPGWWLSNNTTCSTQDIMSVLDYSLALNQDPDGTNKTALTDTGISHNQFSEEFTRKLTELNYNYIFDGLQCFDGIWTFAFALNLTINELANNVSLNTLAKEANGDHYNDTDEFKIEDFTYKNYVVKQLMFNHLSNTNFEGITGPVSFTSQGIRTVNRLRVLQYRVNASEYLSLNEIASVFVNQDDPVFRYHSNITDQTVWTIIPYDGVPETEIVSVALPITVIYTLLAVCGIVFSIGCLVFIVVYRKKKLIKLTSPKLNYIIIIGAIIMYISVVIYTIPGYTQIAETILCNIRPRLFSLGYSLCFGTILAKMWRVYYIVTNPSPKRKTVKDWHLALFVLVVLLIDLIFIGVLTAINGGRTQAELINRKEKPSDERGELGYKTNYFTYVCESKERDIWLGILYGYKGVLQVIALFLAFGTRKVKVKGLNDSKFIAATIYITSIVLVIEIIASITVNEYVNTFSVLFATSILIMATVILSLVFIPQMVGLYRDPTGKNVFSETTANSVHNNKSDKVTLAAFLTTEDLKVVNDPFLGDKEKIEFLAKRVSELEGKMEEKKKQEIVQNKESETSITTL